MTAEPFLAHRSLLFTVAYEMLGSAADAEDVVQETWLRWAGVRDRDDIRDPRAYLVRMVTRQALNRLRTVARQREDYVGQWLPEPLLTSPDVAEDVELAESVSIAMLTVLETLGPAERAVFVLHDVFDVPYDEIAAAVGKTAAAVRQIAHRARTHVAARRPRVDVSRAEQQQAVERFLAALTTGDMQPLMDILAPDVVVVADGGGVVPAVSKPFEGARKLIGLLVTAITKLDVKFTGAPMWLNGAPGVRLTIDERGLAGLDGPLSAAVSFTVANGRITRIYIVSNPQKLARLDAESALAR